MNTIKEIGIIINSVAINYHLGIISLLLNKFKKNQQININFVITNLSTPKNLSSLVRLYKKHLNIIKIHYINILIHHNKLHTINNSLLNRIKKYNFEVLVGREQKNLMPVSDRLIALFFKYQKIYLLEDNLFGYYLDKKNNIFKFLFPLIFTMRKETKNRKSIFTNYKKIIANESVTFKKNKRANDIRNFKALILLDLYHFKTKSHYSKKPSINEIRWGVNIYFNILKKILNKFKLNENNIKLKLHPMTEDYLAKKIKKSILGKFLLKNKENNLPLEISLKNYKKLKFCFSIGSSSPIFLKDLYKIKPYVIKTNEIIKEPNYIYLSRLAKSRFIDFVSF